MRARGRAGDAQSGRGFPGDAALPSTRRKRSSTRRTRSRWGSNPNRGDLSERQPAIARARQVRSLARHVRSARACSSTRREIDEYLQGEWREHLRRCAPNWRQLKKAHAAASILSCTRMRDTEKPKTQHVYCAAIAPIPARRSPRFVLAILCAGEPAAVQQGQRPAGTGGSHRRPAESADRPRDGESHLAASFRTGHRAHAQQFRRSWASVPRIRNCWIIWRARFVEQQVVDEGDASRDHALGRVPVERGLLGGELRARIRTTGCCGAPTGSGWMRRRCATRCCSLPGNLDLKLGGPPESSTTENHRRTVYGFISRRKLDPMLALFDFPIRTAPASSGW